MLSEEWLQVISSICFLQVKLKMNYHGCIDTLQEECKRWFEKHARDGTNKTARARREKTQTNKQLHNEMTILRANILTRLSFQVSMLHDAQ